jgi:hypothetical protein
MELSRHAEVRKQQRGFQADDIELITIFGTSIRKPGNAVEFQMREKDARRLLQAISRIKDKAVLMNYDERTVITVYTLDKKRKEAAYGNGR